MEGSAQRGSGDVAVAHVKTEAADENTPALVVGGHESPAPRGGAACGGGGAAQPAEELADTELQAAATTTPVLLYPVSTDRFFTTSGDGKTYLTIAPASVMPPAPPEKTLPLGSDFSSKAVLCLIEAVGRRWGLYETRERSQLFQSVQEELASKGHILPVEKIRRKWNNLIVTYKRVKDRSRETGHAKTSWEFFDLMDATLCDTVGSHLANNKRHRGGGSAAALASAPAKVTAKSPLPQAAATIARPHKGDFEMTGGAGAESVGQGAATSQITSVSTAKISSSGASELKPLVVLNGDAGSLHPPTVVPSPPFLSSPCVTETTSIAASFGSAGTSTDPNTPRYVSHEAPSFSPGVVPFRLNVTSHSSSKNLLGLSSSFPPTFSCPAPSAAAASSSASSLASEGQNQKGDEEQSSLLPEILKRQEEQAFQDRVACRRVEAREKRRERREVRMAESLGRIATALELLSSKQDTVIALLQRLADRK